MFPVGVKVGLETCDYWRERHCLCCVDNEGHPVQAISDGEYGVCVYGLTTASLLCAGFLFVLLSLSLVWERDAIIDSTISFVCFYEWSH